MVKTKTPLVAIGVQMSEARKKAIQETMEAVVTIVETLEPMTAHDVECYLNGYDRDDVRAAVRVLTETGELRFNAAMCLESVGGRRVEEG